MCSLHQAEECHYSVENAALTQELRGVCQTLDLIVALKTLNSLDIACEVIELVGGLRTLQSLQLFFDVNYIVVI